MCCVLKSKNVYFTWKYAHQNMGHPAAFGQRDVVMDLNANWSLSGGKKFFTIVMQFTDLSLNDQEIKTDLNHKTRRTDRQIVAYLTVRIFVLDGLHSMTKML